MILRQREFFGWPPTEADPAEPSEGLVLHYNGSATSLREHADCVAYWQRVRRFHIDGNGWVDIGYSFGVCPHGEVFAGRGFDRYQAAQGTTAGNTDYYSVSLMIGGVESPTEVQLGGLAEFRGLLLDLGVTPCVRGHREFFATECPGAVVGELLDQGFFS
ncbi:peptidoglycan recognition family protein [Streptomyces sp. NPDC058665]|uniref:peptidoglycan recognition protein family protein n=1 Tax=Streptomyces sp. NPDC058665 TaxID=3346586 RepID=UPI0036558F8C